MSLDVIVIGAGAAGLMCAIEAGKRGRKVLVIDHANKPGKKILMSGGGRCNFTNYHVTADNYISHNPHFCKSALSRYTQWDFINLVKHYKIPFHEKAHGQLFCDNKAKELLNILLAECEANNVSIHLDTSVENIKKTSGGFAITANNSNLSCESLVIATGGLSIPTMGASPFAYKVAEQFGIKVWPTRAGLVPITLHEAEKQKLAVLSGISVDSVVNCRQQSFRENILFTHRGLSGPAILQISSYWQAGEEIAINLLPGCNLLEVIAEAKQQRPQLMLRNLLADYLPKRVVEVLLEKEFSNTPLQQLSQKRIQQFSSSIHQWQVKPNSTEGYRTAEVTLGGVDCNAISSKTMQANAIRGLYFIGEALDVTGWLGGFNFQWAWSSGWVAGQTV